MISLEKLAFMYEDLLMEFDLEVADENSATALRWKRESQTNGHVGVTGGGREYGLS